MAKETSVEVQIEDRTLKLTNLEKILYPETGFNKAQVIDYYTRIAPAILPHTRDHPLTLKRYPNGVDAEYFYEKNCPKHRPPWVQTATVWSGGNNRDMYYCLAQDVPTLVWLANLATLEYHTSLSLADNLPEPRTMVFDLDPGPPATIVECCRIGLMLRDVFAEHGLECFAKTSGLEGPAAVRAAEHEGHLRGDQGRLQGPGPALRGAAPRPRRAQTAEGAAHRSRADRLEPERPVQDHRQRLFAARTRATHRVDAGDLG